jgi:hypothetical protein
LDDVSDEVEQESFELVGAIIYLFKIGHSLVEGLGHLLEDAVEHIHDVLKLPVLNTGLYLQHVKGHRQHAGVGSDLLTPLLHSL